MLLGIRQTNSMHVSRKVVGGLDELSDGIYFPSHFMENPCSISDSFALYAVSFSNARSFELPYARVYTATKRVSPFPPFKAKFECHLRRHRYIHTASRVGLTSQLCT